MEYPHLTSNEFPNVNNVNVYKYTNRFDYKRWNAGTKIKLCAVPWCGDFDNVVKFENVEARDAYLDTLNGEQITLETDFRVLPGESVKVPLPFDMCAQYNYIIVDFTPAPGASPFIDYETANGKKRWLFFIDNMEFKAPNTTELFIHLDYWSTYIYDLQVSQMTLERGHAPMALVSVDEYLTNPKEHCAGLLTNDVFVEKPNITKERFDAIVNKGDMLVCFSTSANLAGNWGNEIDATWEVAEINENTISGAPINLKLFGVSADSYSAFCDYIAANLPQFVATVQGVFLIPTALVLKATTFTVGTITVFELSPNNGTLAQCQLTKSSFAYPEQYADITKLYTAPYAHLELVNYATGFKSIINIEDTAGSITLNGLPNLLFPFVSVDIIANGIGGVGDSVTFERIGAQGIFSGGGVWYDHIVNCRIPCWAMTLGNSKYYNYSTFFSRRQKQDTFDFDYDFTTGNQDLIISNNKIAKDKTLAILANSYREGRDNLTYQWNAVADKLETDVRYLWNYYNSSATATQAQTVVDNTAGASNALITTLGNIISSGTDPKGGGVLAGLAGSLTVAGTTNVNINARNSSTAILLTKDRELTQAQETAMREKYNTDLYLATTLYDNDYYHISLTNTTDALDATVEQLTATKNFVNTKANLYKELQEKGVTREISTAELMQPVRFGDPQAGDSAGIRPVGAFLQVVTMSDGEVELIGDTFLRYGYQYDAPFKIRTLTPMSKFSYWKGKDVWLSGRQDAIEGAQRAIKEMFNLGVTIWSNPNDIGVASIYENEVVNYG